MREHQGEQDVHQLMLQSRQLVGQARNVISGELQFFFLCEAIFTVTLGCLIFELIKPTLVVGGVLSLQSI